MGLAIRAELRKFFTTRMWWGMALAMFLASVAFALLFAFLVAGAEMGAPGSGAARAPGLDNPEMVKMVYTSGASVGYLLTLAVGILIIGSEYRHKTITSTFLATPRRAVVMGAKVIALVCIGAFYAVVSLVGSIGTGAAVILAKGYSPFPDSSIWRSLAMALLALAVWALIGLGAGILIPNQVAALLVSIGIAWIVEPILGTIVAGQSWGRSVAPYFPSNATNAMLSIDSAAMGASSAYTPLVWWVAALVLVAYAAVMAGVGTVLTIRKDIV